MLRVMAVLGMAVSFALSAQADICETVEGFARAVELSDPTDLTDTPVLGAGETECSAMIGLERGGMSALRMGVGMIDCYWDNSDDATFAMNEVSTLADEFSACSALNFAGSEDYGDSFDYQFDYGDQTLLLLGYDESGMYLNIFRDE